MTLASAVGATISFKHFSLPLLRLRQHKPHLLSLPTSTAAVLTRRRAWTAGDGDGVVKSLRFRLSAATLAGGALVHDAGATAVVMAGAYGLVLTFDVLTQRNLMEQSLSRKVVHILSGLLFMACWPIFSTSTEARYFASLVPLANCLRLVTHGLSLATDEGLIKSVTREGKPEELLRGPLYYVLVLIVCVLVFWRDSPTGVISLAMMCGGDGIADIMGRRFGAIKIPYNEKKSWAGSISMFVFGFLISMGMLYYFSAFGYFQLDWLWTTERVALVSFVATFVESLSTTETVDDNISVTLASMVNAAATTQQMLDLFDITGIVHFGIAGNANNSMSIGDVSIPQQVAHTGIWDWLGMKLEQCVNSSLCLPQKPKLVVGLRGSTANIFVDNAAYREFLFNTFHVSSVDMESSAVVTTSLSNGFAVIVIRGLSDLAGGQPGKNSIDIFGPLAALNTAKVVIQFVKTLP
ncbi:phytol kinase 1 VTE5 [Actinidia rufa]|uniref:Phytol kinase 1 VTE5 n=1 Tax=Actinidia rufa TaxID=165716 RepID=A0A7J0DAT2_9ERIC|nr:phytol kinase 1 VTE5 [Actinidia rufa]